MDSVYGRNVTHVVPVAAHDGAVPDTRLIADEDVSDHTCVWCNPNAVWTFWMALPHLHHRPVPRHHRQRARARAMHAPQRKLSEVPERSQMFRNLFEKVRKKVSLRPRIDAHVGGRTVRWQ